MKKKTSSKNESIEWVFFDAGGTLLGTNPEEEHWYEQFFIDACAAEGQQVTLAQVHEALHEATLTCNVHPRCSSPEQVRAFWEHIYSTVFERLLPGRNALEVARHYITRFEQGEFVELFPDTLSALQLAKRLGLRCAIVSNFGAYLARFLEQCGIAPYFEFAVISAIEGCEKPQPEIFKRALERAGAIPARVLFVGDSIEEDFHPAQRIGMRALLIDRHDKYADREDVARIRRLDEFVNYL